MSLKPTTGSGDSAERGDQVRRNLFTIIVILSPVMRRRAVLAAVPATLGVAGCTGARSTGVEVLEQSVTGVEDGTATVRVRLENGRDGGHVEVRVELAWLSGPDAGETFETYSDVVYLSGGERRWIEVPIRHYPARADEYEHRVSAAATDRPLARFEYSPREAAVGDVIELDAGESQAVEGAIAAFDWRIRDRHEIGRLIEYELETGDREGFPVELRVTDTQGASDAVVRTVGPFD